MQSEARLLILLPIAAAILVVIVIIVIICVVVRRRRKTRYSNEIPLTTYQPPVTPVAEYVPLSTQTSYAAMQGRPKVEINSQQTIRVSSPSNSWEIMYHQLQIKEEVGAGSFGKVYRGKWREGVVAIKVLKNVTERDLIAFRNEAELMK